MSDDAREFQTTVIRPVECFREGWELIRGQYWLFAGITTVGLLLGAIAPLCILMGPMMSGIYLCYFSKMRGEPVKFETLFRGFDFFVPSLVASMLIIGGMFIVMIPIMMVFMIGWVGLIVATTGAQPNAAPPPGFFLGMFSIFLLYVVAIVTLSLAFGVLYAFVYPLIVDKKLDGIAALKMAMRAAWGNLRGILGVMLIGMGLGFVGMLCCYVGALLVAPIYLGALAVAYRRVFPEIARRSDGVAAAG